MSESVYVSVFPLGEEWEVHTPLALAKWNLYTLPFLYKLCSNL